MRPVIKWYPQPQDGGKLKPGHFAVHPNEDEVYFGIDDNTTVNLIHDQTKVAQVVLQAQSAYHFFTPFDGMAINATTVQFPIRLPHPLRQVPTTIAYTGTVAVYYWDGSVTVRQALTGIRLGTASTGDQHISVKADVTSIAEGTVCALVADIDPTASITIR